MRVEGYELHLYCDNRGKCAVYENLSHRMEWGASEQYTGFNRAEAYKKARDDGWRMGKRDICPECVKRSRRS